MPSTPIAVIGLSARYAGNVQNPDALWAHLKAGIDPIQDFPEGRWDKGFLDADRSTPGRAYTFAGGYLEQVDQFDADFFGISPREAAQMDPQQRLLLELAWEAFEDAGLVPGALAGSKTAVYVGLSSRDYAELVNEEIVNAYTNLGLSMSIASNRVSYIFDLKGPSMTVDTACSSGMVALHQAVQAIRHGECTQALVGAVNLLMSPASYIGFSKASMLSPAGRCTSFDANGAGYVRAEGGGFMMLKPMDEAERDGDRILGVILASGVNSDGHTMGIALPNPVAQAALLKQVYEEAGIRPDDVYYLEAHGTGTAVGDPIECEAIANILGKDNRGAVPLRIGSIKSNVGHLENGAAIAGITKVLLALKHREIPANLHFKTPNPKIDFEGWKLEVVHQPHPLPQTEQPLIFGVNSFGFGGTNGHCVIQEYRSKKPAPQTVGIGSGRPPQPELLMLSAQSEAALAALAGRWVDHLAGPQAADWTALRANALHHRSHLAHRLVLEAPTAEAAAQRLAAWRGDGSAVGKEPVPGLLVGKAPLAAVEGVRLRTAFVFAGNGPQWWAMGRELMQAHDLFSRTVKDVDRIFSQLAGWSLLEELLRDEADSRMAKTEVAQPTLFAIQVGLTVVLREAGIEADAVIGHSVGEAAAAWASGALSLEQATHVIHQRSLAQSATAGMGRMAALGVSAEEARAAIERVGGFLELAAINSPSAVTVAGDRVQLEQLCAELTEAGRFARMLTLDYPFHTQAMDGIQEGLLKGLAGLKPDASTCPFVSTVEGRVIDGQQLDATYWWRNIREPVVFEAGTTHLLVELGITGLIEISPHPVLRDYVLQTAKARDTAAQVLTTLRRPREGQVSEPELMRQAVLQAYAHGLADPCGLAQRPAVRLPMPLYAWHRQRHWRGTTPLAGMVRARTREHPLLGWRATDIEPSWEQVLDRTRLGYLADHVIQDSALYPGAGYIEMALAAGRSLHGDVPLQLEDLDFLKPMTLPGNSPWPRVHMGVDASDGTCEVATRDHDETTVHARCRITRAEASHRPPKLDVAAALATLHKQMDPAAHYAGTVRRGMHYGPLFQGLKSIALSTDDGGLRAIARVELPEAFGEADTALDGYRSHPAVLDACLQALVTLLAQRDPEPLACIPVRVDRLRSFAPLPRALWCEVTLLRDSPRAGRARFTLYDDNGECLMVTDGTSFQKVDFRAGQDTPHLADRWRPDTAAAVPLPAAVHAVTLSAPPAAEAPRWTPEDGALIDSLCGAIAAQALQRLHAEAGLAAGEPFAANALWRRARVPAELRPLATALLQMAQADGWLNDADDGLQFAGAQPVVDALWQSALRARPALTAELMLLLPVVDRLVSRLAPPDDAPAADGAPDAADGPNPSFLAALGDSAPFMADAHSALAGWLQQLLAARQPERALRVLQLHAARTGTTAALLAGVPATG
ncbi:MAG: type I polyketide synthase, partial [Aquabacterium sp.]|nr:type I polyketide synthase [Aquabacterium sp.]